MNIIKAGEGFTVNQVLNSNGFTLDTTDFPDLLDEDEELDHAKTVQLNNEEMLRLLNLEEGNDEQITSEGEGQVFIGVSFNTIRPRMTSIYGDGEVLKLTKKEGVGEVVPKDAQVTVEYVGYFEDHDEPFDSTLFHREKKMTLRLGKGWIIQGLEIAISSMKKYEKSLFLIKPSLAYGKLGCLPRIPQNAEVLFKVELFDFLDNGSADLYEELSNEEKRKFTSIEKIVRDLMATAKDNFKKQKTKQAIREYNRCVNYLEGASLDNDEDEANMNKLLTRALTNLTVCYNNVHKPKLVCASFERLPTKSGKAYYQNGKALMQLGQYDEAMSSLQKARSLSPGDVNVYKEIQKLEQCRQKYHNFSKLFAQNSLKLVNGTKNSEFEQVAIDMCKSFINDETLLKHEIPHGLSLNEQDCIRRVAAANGLTITKQTRYGTEKMFLTKKAYYSREMI